MIERFSKPKIALGLLVIFSIKSSKCKTEFTAPNALSKPITPSLASLNSTFLCSISIGLRSEVIMSITPDLIPFTRLFVSDFVLKGGDVLKLLSKPCNSSSFNVK